MQILIVEDCRMIREATVKICLEKGHEILAEATNGKEAVTLSRELRPNLVLLDLGLPDIRGTTVAETLREDMPDIKILVLSGHLDDYWLYRIERLSVQGFIDKNLHTVSAIGEALDAVAEGRKWFSPTFSKINEARRRDSRSFDKTLSPREQAVLGLLRQGLSNDEIAELLDISVRTAEDHSANIRRKLNVNSAAKLLAYAVDKGF